MSSNPTTPLAYRRQFMHEPTRIPQPSPKLLRRSLSLRLRGPCENGSGGSRCDYSGGGGGGDGGDNYVDFYHTTTNIKSPIKTSSPLPTTTTTFGRKNASNTKELKYSKSCQFSSNMTTHGIAKKDTSSSSVEVMPTNKNSPTTVAVPVPQKGNCLASNGGGGGSSGDTGLCLTFSGSPTSQKCGKNCHRNSINVSTKDSPISPINGYMDDDLESLYSFTSVASGRSAMSGCDHPHVARNGTTFSGRRMKYVVHCSSYAGQTGEEYLTPTQRAQKHIRRLKELLAQARMDLEQKDSEILRLTKEVVELRLFKASLNSPEERSNSSDAVTVRENKTSQDVSPIADITDHGIKSTSSRHEMCSHLNPFLEKMCNSEMQSSFSDSGHFEDLTTSSINSKDSFVQTCDKACGGGGGGGGSAGAVGSDFYDQQRHDLIKMYEEKIEELIKCHDAQTQEIKVNGSDRIEALLQKLAECNTRYADLVPDYEQAKDKIRELEKQLEDLQHKLQEQEDKQNKMYLHMYQQGQEAERISQADRVLKLTKQETNRVSVPELMQQLQVTQDELENIKDTNYVQASESSPILLSAKEAISLWLLGARKTMYRRLIDAQQTKNKVDPEITLQFLKSAVYYFLTDKENTQGHLNAIESILGFSDSERFNIDRARAAK